MGVYMTAFVLVLPVVNVFGACGYGKKGRNVAVGKGIS